MQNILLYLEYILLTLILMIIFFVFIIYKLTLVLRSNIMVFTFYYVKHLNSTVKLLKEKLGNDVTIRSLDRPN